MRSQREVEVIRVCAQKPAPKPVKVASLYSLGAWFPHKHKGQTPNYVECDTLSAVPPAKDWINKYVKPARPVVLKGLAKHWPAVRKVRSQNLDPSVLSTSSPLVRDMDFTLNTLLCAVDSLIHERQLW